MFPPVHPADGSRCPKLRCGQQLLDRGELPSTRRGCRRTFDEGIIVFLLIAFLDLGLVLPSLALNPCKMRPNLLRRKYAPHPRNEPGQLPREFTMIGSGAGE